MAPYTINGSQVATQALWDVQWATVMDGVQAIEAAGGTVVLTTPLANNSFSATQNGYRVNQLRRVLSSGLPVINFESMADSTGKFAFAADHIGDGTHPAGGTPLFGHDKMANLAFPTLAALVP
jgi:hypothetical protein